jgi:hypothetical protein
MLVVIFACDRSCISIPSEEIEKNEYTCYCDPEHHNEVIRVFEVE